MFPSAFRLGKFAIAAGTSALLYGCANSAPHYGFSSYDQSFPASTITLTEALTVTPDTARAPLIASDRSSIHCNVEVNTVNRIGDPPATIEPDEFTVVSSRVHTNPPGLRTRLPVSRPFGDFYSFFELTRTIRVSSDDQPDVRAINCTETFNFIEDATVPTVADLREVAGSALVF
jgi:hypothetical protein